MLPQLPQLPHRLPNTPHHSSSVSVEWHWIEAFSQNQKVPSTPLGTLVSHALSPSPNNQQQQQLVVVVVAGLASPY
ncbi:hypothetical protein E2C01_072323 [Portunus trituberculatus]|uniref:Uncharacterized protein n=1 Tax=Portunus trituberculatus TaxID=210409 RepID=A0A5B7IAW4_PORTR|nr:hypothetical protein [Portunus trituberculatus]